MQCKTCGKTIPKFVPNIEGVSIRTTPGRTKCFECSPYVAPSTKKDKYLDMLSRYTDAELTTCSSCGKKYPSKLINTGSYTRAKCNSCNANGARFAKKQKCLDYKGGKCAVCGYNKTTRVLSFHHTDPSTKLFTISGAHARSWDVLRAELDKCQLLCMNCLNALHSNVDHSSKRCDLKNKYVQHRGGKCEKCGYDRHVQSMSFHHPHDDKVFNISDNKPWEETLVELEKCVLLCMNCHAEEHHQNH